VNLILFQPEETVRPLPRTDPRAVHVLTVLRRQAGDTFDAGLVNGPRGKGRVGAIGTAALDLSFVWEAAVPPPEPVVLIIGLPRPQTARKILQEATSLGVGELHFVTTEKGEPGYGSSTLWTDGEWRRHVRAGAEQAFSTRVPNVTFGQTLAAAVAVLPAGSARAALDNYEATTALARWDCPPDAAAGTGECTVVLALGPERGWSQSERGLLRSSGFTLAHLGTRVLRTETACTAALTLVRAKLGLLQ
jgi:RsmE family RNA methyltransferase